MQSPLCRDQSSPSPKANFSPIGTRVLCKVTSV